MVIAPPNVTKYYNIGSANGYSFCGQPYIRKIIFKNISIYGRQVVSSSYNIEEIYSYTMTTPQFGDSPWSFTFDKDGGWTKDTKIYYPKGGWAWTNKTFSTPIACDLDEYGRLIIPEN